MEISVIKNNIFAQPGRGVLLLAGNDYEVYVDKMKKILEAETLPEEIKEAQRYISQCESDMGFMGSPKYDEYKKLVEGYFSKKNKAEKNRKIEFLCDICGQEKTGKKFPVLDENWNKQEGIKQCEDCFKDGCGIE